MLADRVKETTSTTGTGTVTTAGAASGHQSFATALPSGGVVEYALVSGTAWETGRGTFTPPSTLTRDQVYASSAAGAKISLFGTSDVFITATAETFNGKQPMHGFHLASGAPTAITNGLRRTSLDNGANVDLTYDSSTRQITLTQTGGIVYWYKGRKVTISSPLVSTAHSATAGSYYIYFADTTGTLTISGTAWNLQEHVPVAEVYYDGAKGTAWDERHAAQRDPILHTYLHATQGARWGAGGVLSSYTIEGTTDASVQFALSSASIYDEDIRVDTGAVAAAGPYTIWYKSGGNWTWDSTRTVPYERGTFIQYNNAGTLTDCTAGAYVNYYLYASTSLLAAQRVFLHVGQSQYANLSEALNEGLSNMDFSGTPITECTPMYRMTYYVSDRVSTTGGAVLVDVTRIGGDKNFAPSVNTSTRSPDHMTLGRVVAQVRGLAMP